MRSSLVLSLGLAVAACSFNPSGDGSNDGAIDADQIDACVPASEICSGVDEDCDGMIDEGFTSGAPCDGPDADACLDDMTVCSIEGGEVCGDTSGDDDVELCNGANDDCDGETDEGFPLGDGCDGDDTDMCLEGVFACSQDGTGVSCDDVADDDVEVCNEADDDCDSSTDEDFDLTTDANNCGECGHVCTAALGTNPCVAPGVCSPVCNIGAANCDGNPDNGCEATNTNPTCPASGQVDHQVIADQTGQPTVVMGTTERFLRVRLRETLSADIDITARFALVSGAGTDYDIFIYCPSCNATPLTDGDGTVSVGRDDIDFNDRSFDVWVEIRLDTTTPQTTCNPWTLTITGNVNTSNRCAN